MLGIVIGVLGRYFTFGYLIWSLWVLEAGHRSTRLRTDFNARDVMQGHTALSSFGQLNSM